MATCQCKVCGKEEIAQKVTVHNKIRLCAPIGWLEPQLCSTECLQGPNKDKCAYCREPFPAIASDGDWSLRLVNGWLRTVDIVECPFFHMEVERCEDVECQQECVLTKVRINNCPMCGRELKE